MSPLGCADPVSQTQPFWSSCLEPRLKMSSPLPVWSMKVVRFGGGEFQSIGSPGPLSSARLPSISKLPTNEDPWSIPASISAIARTKVRPLALRIQPPSARWPPEELGLESAPSSPQPRCRVLRESRAPPRNRLELHALGE